MLTPEDSKRVADALINKIDEIDISTAVYDAIKSVIMPYSANHWKTDWFPLTITDMCDEIASGVVAAAQDASANASTEI